MGTTESEEPGSPRASVSDLATLPGEGDPSLPPPRSPFDDEAALPDRFGRFAVRGVLGRGGMSRVLDAYDETLDREVALKILHRRTAARHGGRLLREAQALARLSHPNVVQVYEVGEFEGQTFIAMERVRGQTLQQWQEDRPPWRACVGVYIQAGRGLAAAHAVGLVHRDFKPSNAIVDDAGTVRVLDFGLARGRFGSDPEKSQEVPSEAEQELSLKHSMTQTGAVLGTLAYMPFEQLNGEQVDERSDQFSLCVSLYEAVYGERPFDQGSIGALTVALEAGEVRPSPSGVSVPARLRRILLRGLATDPQQRWPSVDALLEQLERLVAPRRAWLAAGVGGAATLIAAALWQGAHRSQPCEAVVAPLEEAWDDERRAEVEAALLATQLPYAADTWASIEPRLDGYARGWVEQATDNCEATRVEGVQSEAVMSLRGMCLSDRRVALREAVDVLSRADAGVVEHAVAVVGGLPRLDRCADVAALQAEVPPPEDPVAAAQVQALRERMAQVRTLAGASRTDEAADTMAAMGPEVLSLAHPPLQAEALLQRGELELQGGRYPEAEALLIDAYALGLEHGHQEVVSDAAQRLIEVASRQAHYGSGQQWGITAMALARRSEPLAQAQPLSALGRLMMEQGQHADALEHYRRALEIRRQWLPAEDPALATSLNDVGNALAVMGEHTEAMAHHEQALELQRRTLGPDHPQIAVTLDRIGAIEVERGRFAEAADFHERALAIRERSQGLEHPDVANTLLTLGVAYRRQELYEEAVAAYQRAIVILESTVGHDHPDMASACVNLGVVFLRQRKHEEGMEQFREAERILVAAHGPEHPQVAIVLDNKGTALQGLGRYDEAFVQHQRALEIKRRHHGEQHAETARSLGNLGRVELRRGNEEQALALLGEALEIFEVSWGPEHPEVAAAMLLLAEVHLQAGRANEALPLAERAVEIFGRGEADGARAGSLWVLGRCLWEVEPPQHRRAVEVVRRARGLYQSQGAAGRRRISQIDAWLTEHPLPPAAG